MLSLLSDKLLMITELFYPKELKKIVADLRSKGDLNEAALIEINKAYILPFIVSFFIFLICLYKNTFFVSLLAGAVVFGLSALYVGYINIHLLAIPYTIGVKVRGTANRVAFHKSNLIYGAQDYWSIDYRYKDINGRDRKKVGSIDVLNMEKSVYETGGEVIVYLHPKNQRLVHLYIPLLFQRFCLSRSRIQERLERGDVLSPSPDD